MIATQLNPSSIAKASFYDSEFNDNVNHWLSKQKKISSFSCPESLVKIVHHPAPPLPKAAHDKLIQALF
jgi:hypothetical protein